MAVASRGRLRRLAGHGALAGILLAATAPIAVCDGDSPPARLDRTDFALTTKTPLREGRNLVWCATIQLAWDSLADALAPGRPLDLGPPAPPDVVAEMNRRAFPHDALDEASFVAIGGLAQDGVVDRIRSAVAAKFPRATPPALALGPGDAIGYARLEKRLPFAVPFRAHPGPMAFAGGPTVVRTFGTFLYDAAEGAVEMSKQIVLHLGKDEAVPMGPWQGVVELRPRDAADRIVLSSLPPGATLEETWAKVAERLALDHGFPVQHPFDVTIPCVRLDALHSFREIVGAPIRGIEGSVVKDASQSVAFTLDEKGAAVASEAKILAYLGVEPEIRFDGPFLLALLRRGAARPYLLLWIANDEVLQRFDMPRMTPAEVAPFVGTWTWDRDASLAEVVEERASHAPGHVTPTQARERARREIEPTFRLSGGRVDVSAEGVVRLDAARPGGGPGKALRVGTLRKSAGKTVVVVDESDSEPAGTVEPIELALVGGRLRVGASETPGDLFRR
jgi:hypothetical protein